RIKKGQSLGTAHAPLREIEQKGREIGGENFRLNIGLKRRRLRFVPQPIADAWSKAPGTSASLVGGGAGYPNGLKSCQADIGLKAWYARQTGINDDVHAINCERRLGDRCRQHDLSPAGRGRRDGTVLGVAFERPEQWRDVDRRIVDAFPEPCFRATDLGGTAPEYQH